MSASGMGTILRLLGIGWYVALCIGGGIIGGYYLDRWLDLTLVFTLLGLAVGLTLAVVGMYRMLIAVLASSSDSDGEGRA